MSMDLVVSDSGHVMIASNEEFPAEILRVDFLTSKKLLMLQYADGHEPLLLNLEVHDRLMSSLLKAPAVLVAQVKNNLPVAGYDVPLVQSDFTTE